MGHLEPIETGEEIIKEDKRCLPSIQMESQNHLDKCEGGQQNPTHNHQQEADFADSHETNFSLNEDNTTANVDKILTKSQEQFIETETEVIESSVNDLLLPKRNSSSPLLFSQETKDVEMGEPSDDECVNATPPREFESTCTWRKEKEVSKSVAVISSDEEMTIDRESTKWNDEKEINKTDKDPKDTNINLQENEPMQTDTLLDKTTMDELENKQTESNNCPADFEIQETSSQTNDKTCIEPDPNLIEEQLLTQNTQKLSKHNLKIVISNIEGDDYVHLERFIDVFNPVIDNDVNQQTNFLIVGVDSENKVLRRTPKFLKAISLHVCIVNVDYVRQCCEEGDIVTLARKFIPLDSSGLNGPIKSYLYQTSSLLDNFVFYSMEEDEYLRSLLEFIIIHNGGVIIADHKLFKAYRGESTQGGTTRGDGFKKVILYGETQAGTMTEVNKMKLFTLGERTQGGTTQGDGFKKVILYGETQAGTMTEVNKMKLFTLLIDVPCPMVENTRETNEVKLYTANDTISNEPSVSSTVSSQSNAYQKLKMNLPKLMQMVNNETIPEHLKLEAVLKEKDELTMAESSRGSLLLRNDPASSTAQSTAYETDEKCTCVETRGCVEGKRWAHHGREL
ncbi:uncharacterized protein LOC103508560 [Diaphorina citri]|uniref:Uncharacterized protein LOC103508560 n=1 Tax=Diaphorina citri TaxID=121845 RepID=A0A1S4EAZ0_DIACI|nr:uncharacterized protein LOC103508560 [Diaphorina citri]